VDSSDAIIVGGYSYSTDLDSQSNAGRRDLMVMKFSSAGAHQRTVLRGGSSNEFAYSLKAGRAEFFVVHVPEHLLGKLWHGLNFRRESFKLFRYVLKHGAHMQDEERRVRGREKLSRVSQGTSGIGGVT
jgi:hypothetical protein